ncbi:cell filamentation protein Fic [Candidatus Saccharibacteria bacterium]|nr:MAG: cell filamentation protein Fic [Candidatus Saccharibacteria bacterium]
MSDDYFADDNLLEHIKLHISDAAALQAAEQAIVTEKTADLLEETPPKDFGLEYLKHIHQVLFGDIYDFAGQIRTVDIAKPDSAVPFAHAAYIVPEAERIFSELRDKKYFSGLDKSAFVAGIVSLAADLNALHPFREGNGRALRLFLILLADHAGYLLDYSQVSAQALIEADKRAFEGDSTLLLAMYEKVVIPQAPRH